MMRKFVHVSWLCTPESYSRTNESSPMGARGRTCLRCCHQGQADTGRPYAPAQHIDTTRLILRLILRFRIDSNVQSDWNNPHKLETSTSQKPRQPIEATRGKESTNKKQSRPTSPLLCAHPLYTVKLSSVVEIPVYPVQKTQDRKRDKAI